MASRIDIILAEAKAQVRAELQAEMAVVAAESATTRAQRDAASTEIATLRSTVSALEHEVMRWKQEADARSRALQAVMDAESERQRMINIRTAKWGRFRTVR